MEIGTAWGPCAAAPLLVRAPVKEFPVEKCLMMAPEDEEGGGSSSRSSPSCSCQANTAGEGSGVGEPGSREEEEEEEREVLYEGSLSSPSTNI